MGVMDTCSEADSLSENHTEAKATVGPNQVRQPVLYYRFDDPENSRQPRETALTKARSQPEAAKLSAEPLRLRLEVQEGGPKQQTKTEWNAVAELETRTDCHCSVWSE